MGKPAKAFGALFNPAQAMDSQATALASLAGSNNRPAEPVKEEVPMPDIQGAQAGERMAGRRGRASTILTRRRAPAQTLTGIQSSGSAFPYKA